MKLTVKITNVNYKDVKKNFYILKVSIIKNTNSVFKLKNTTLWGNTTETLCKNDVIEIDANYNKSKNCLDLIKIISRSNGENEALINFFVENTEKISKTTFQKIFKEHTLEEIEKNPTILNDYKIGKTKKNSFMATLTEYKKRTEIHHFAIVSGFTIKQANKIYEIYRDNFYSILENPYKLYFSKILTWKECDLLHLKWDLKENIKERALLTKQIFDYCYLNGNTCIPKTEIKNKILLDEMLENGTYKEYKNCIYFKKLYDIERQLEKRIKEVAKNENDEIICTTQEKAIQNALTHCISIITGGPGTGKTYTINKIVEELEKRHFSYCLLAPTGKAADRMGEITGKETSTIHRKLGLTISEYTEPNMIEEDYIIIDEFSMIDIELTKVLFDNISDFSKIVIVGDVNQLPSVGVGNVLNDLIDSNLIKVTKLTRVFRQQKNSGILENSYNIIDEKDINLSYDDFKFINTDDIDFIQDYIIKNYNKDTTQILCSQHSGAVGTDALNLLIQNKQDDDEQKFQIGDKVIQTINNYDLNVYNGNIGTIEGIKQKVILGELQNIITVNFENVNKVIEYDNSNSKELELAYALTIHKSQGSEFQKVIIPVVSSDEFLLYKNLIYTGITRSKKEVVLIGDFETFERCRKIKINRISNLLK